MKTAWHLATAAVSLTAAQFARCGWDVSLPHGDSQSEYDLEVTDGDETLKVWVNGSRGGAWSVTRGFTKDRSYHEAVDAWLCMQGAKTVVCLVQFENVQLQELPRLYLATPVEIATRLKAARAGQGDSVLYEDGVWSAKSVAFGLVGWVPSSWRFTEERLEKVALALLQVTTAG